MEKPQVDVLPFILLLWGSLLAGFGAGWVFQYRRLAGVGCALAWLGFVMTQIPPWWFFGYLMPTVAAGIGGAIVAHCRQRAARQANGNA